MPTEGWMLVLSKWPVGGRKREMKGLCGNREQSSGEGGHFFLNIMNLISLFLWIWSELNCGCVLFCYRIVIYTETKSTEWTDIRGQRSPQAEELILLKGQKAARRPRGGRRTEDSKKRDKQEGGFHNWLKESNFKRVKLHVAELKPAETNPDWWRTYLENAERTSGPAAVLHKHWR